MEQTVVLRMEGIDPDKPMFANMNREDSPEFSTQEVAKMFFGRSPHWMRWRERKGFFNMNGTPVTAERTDSNIRRYRLDDIERLAHALASNHAISTRQLMLTLRMLQLQGQMFNIL